MTLIIPKRKLIARNIKEQLRHIKKILVEDTTVPTPKIGKESE